MKNFDFALYRYFKRRLNVFCEFIPQIVFLTFLFFYMVLLIFIKWVSYGPNPGHYGSNETGMFLFILFIHCVFFHYLKISRFVLFSEYVQVSPYCAPSILITFINMVLMKSSPERTPCDTSMYSGQMGFQKLLVVVAVLCIPVMLFAKPYFVMKESKMRTVSICYLFTYYILNNFDPNFKLNNS